MATELGIPLLQDLDKGRTIVHRCGGARLRPPRTRMCRSTRGCSKAHTREQQGEAVTTPNNTAFMSGASQRGCKAMARETERADVQEYCSAHDLEHDGTERCNKARGQPCQTTASVQVYLIPPKKKIVENSS
ncbi:uncharacterized protein LOC119294729 isoform X2 [Triticum dicoccoides]|uniref:uncharacterized protein LOC119294729 isoform X2 n=1 Tax=Triticum dicoccoides TaxID=85692 RepID=UPI00188E3105|nr:uncharacterized protein LOC119294729 isoform X2 [Triticum dicoccoides]